GCHCISFSVGQRPNNSFKPSPLRGLVVGVTRRQRAGLTQPLAVILGLVDRVFGPVARVEDCLNEVSELERSECIHVLLHRRGGRQLRSLKSIASSASCVQLHTEI